MIQDTVHNRFVPAAGIDQLAGLDVEVRAVRPCGPYAPAAVGLVT